LFGVAYLAELSVNVGATSPLFIYLNGDFNRSRLMLGRCNPLIKLPELDDDAPPLPRQIDPTHCCSLQLIDFPLQLQAAVAQLSKFCRAVRVPNLRSCRLKPAHHIDQ
jgi:hypothetical protein